MGSTITSFRLRFNNHKSQITFHSKASGSEKDKEDLIYKHFCSEGHRGVSNIDVMLIDRVFGEELLQMDLIQNTFFIRRIDGRAREISCLHFVLIVIFSLYFVRYVYVWLLLISCVSTLYITCVFNG